MILRGNVYSKMLEMETGISLLFPKEYKNKNNYKVVYLLHGLHGCNSDWLNYTMLPVYANNYNMIFIMPDAVRSFYTDMKYGQKYFSYILEELPEICKSFFNISHSREDTAVMGASMGGYGALKTALSKPEQYSCCCAFSSACLFLKEGMDYQRAENESEKFKQQFGEQLIRDFYGAFGRELEWSPEIEILELAKKSGQKDVKPKIFSAIGRSDYFYSDNIRFKNEMEKLSFNFAFEEWEGEHNWYFFNQALKKGIEFFDKQ